MMRCVHAGYGSGDNNHAIITPVMAVGTSSGTIYLQNVSTLQVSTSSPASVGLPLMSGDQNWAILRASGLHFALNT